jgi:splicing factor 3B subunit 3
MYLYNLTLQRPTGIVCAVYGNFSGAKSHEIAVSRGQILELLRPDDNGKLQSIFATEIFGLIRSLAPFRLPGKYQHHQHVFNTYLGAPKDYLIVGSDSGRIVILEYNANKNVFEKVHQETFGKSGCRRIVPGQYLATDPKSRAVMIGAIEKQKFVYILNRDSAARLTISSPLEAHKAHTIIHSMCGVDVGFENPVFACLEVDYDEEPAEKVSLVNM